MAKVKPHLIRKRKAHKGPAEASEATSILSGTSGQFPTHRKEAELLIDESHGTNGSERKEKKARFAAAAMERPSSSFGVRGEIQGRKANQKCDDALAEPTNLLEDPRLLVSQTATSTGNMSKAVMVDVGVWSLALKGLQQN